MENLIETKTDEGNSGVEIIGDPKPEVVHSEIS